MKVGACVCVREREREREQGAAQAMRKKIHWEENGFASIMLFFFFHYKMGK